MQKYIETIINALKFWIRNDAFDEDYALELIIEEEFMEPLRAVDGTIYTDKNGDIYVL